jgi:hypothetical protein
MRLSASGNSIVGMQGSVLKQCVLLSFTLFHFAACAQTIESQSDSKGDSKVIYFVITPTPCALCYEKLFHAVEGLEHLASVVPVIIAPRDPAIASLLITQEAKRTPFEPSSFIVSSVEDLGLKNFKGSIRESPLLVLRKGDRVKVMSYSYLHSDNTSVTEIVRRMKRFLK